jgi:hypothetical protein
MSLVVRSKADRARLAEEVRSALRGIDPEQPASALRPASETIVEPMARR